MKNRILIPLCTEPFFWFAHGTKKWELRKIGKLYNSRRLSTGSVVELRRGYNAKNGVIWGIIRSIRTFNSLCDVFNEIPYEELIQADNKEAAITIASHILDIGQFESVPLIAIKIHVIPASNIIHFSEKHIPLIQSGEKRSTIRIGKRTYPQGIYIALDDGGKQQVVIEILSTRVILVSQIATSDALEDGYKDVDELLHDLKTYYPSISPSSEITIVNFRKVESFYEH